MCYCHVAAMSHGAEASYLSVLAIPLAKLSDFEKYI